VSPTFLLGCGLTPVRELNLKRARELAEVILDDHATKIDSRKSEHRGLPFKEARYLGKHIAYAKLGSHLRGSDRAERIYATVKIFMRASLLQAEACKAVATILGAKLGNSKRGRPVKSRHPKQKHEIVRAIYNGYERRNPFPPSQDSADFIDSRAEFWFVYAVAVHAWRNGPWPPPRTESACREALPGTLPQEWKPCAETTAATEDGRVWRVPFPREALPNETIVQSVKIQISRLPGHRGRKYGCRG
jgi:hypothetical protein